MTLTRPPKDARQAAARFAHRARQMAGSWEWIWTLEVGKDPEHVHLHAVVRSPFLHWSMVSTLAVDAGYKENSWIAEPDGQAAAYSAKCAGYAAKGYAAYPDWLRLNGKRPWHWSRGYTRGVPMREWIPWKAPSEDPGPWVRIPAREQASYGWDRVWSAALDEQDARAMLTPELVDRVRADGHGSRMEHALRATFDASEPPGTRQVRAREGDRFRSGA